MQINHIEDADLKTLRNILARLYDATGLKDGDRRDLANLMRLILDRIVSFEYREREHEDG